MKKYVVVLLHTGYWIMFLIVLSLFSLDSSHGTKIGVLDAAFTGSIISASIGFYAFYGIIFDKYLAKKKFRGLFLFGSLVILIAAVVTETLVYLIYNLDFFYRGIAPIIITGVTISLLSLVNGTLGLVMKGFITWYKDIQLKLELSKKNHDMELALIKAQINPHFLFNTINNIDTLIKKNPSTASDYLNKLSDIMRFMLYESKTEKIPLAKEISYIDKYVELQKIRTSNENFVKYEVRGDADSIAIEPMMLIPFIENAFKHSENKKIQEAVKILIKITVNKLYFECVNAHLENQKASAQGGLGNELIQRRIELLYPNKHTFEVTDNDGYYKVKLNIDLSDHK